MKKNIKFYNLVRKMYQLEREYISHIPWELNATKWGESTQWKDIKKMGDNDLSVEHQLEYNRIVNERVKIWVKFKKLLTPDEYERWSIESQSSEYVGKVSNQWIMSDSQESMQDDLPVIYRYLGESKDNNTKEKHRIEINGVETTFNDDCYYIMEYIRGKYPLKERFDFKGLLYDLAVDGSISKDYRGKPHDLFRRNSEVFNILFEPLKSPRGYWICKVDYWGD